MKIYLTALKINAKISSSKPFEINNKLEYLLNAYIPGVKILKVKPKKINFEISIIESKKKKLVINKNKIYLYDHLDKELSLDFFHLLYSKFREEFIKRQLYPVHAACIGIKDYILIVGHTKSGKTTTLLELLKDNRKIFSGNKTVISLKNGITAVAGTKTITISSKDLNKNISKNIDYADRKAFLVEDKFYSHKKSVKINKIFIVRLNSGVREEIKLSSLSALHQLYPYFLDVVNADTIVLSGDDVFSSQLSKETNRLLAKNLFKSLKHCSAYYLTGPGAFIAKCIEKK